MHPLKWLFLVNIALLCRCEDAAEANWDDVDLPIENSGTEKRPFGSGSLGRYGKRDTADPSSHSSDELSKRILAHAIFDGSIGKRPRVDEASRAAAEDTDTDEELVKRAFGSLFSSSYLDRSSTDLDSDRGSDKNAYKLADAKRTQGYMGLGSYGKRGFGVLGLGNYGKRGYGSLGLGKYGKRGYGSLGLGKYGKRGDGYLNLGRYGKRSGMMELGKYGKRQGLLGMGKYGKRDGYLGLGKYGKRGGLLGLGRYGKRGYGSAGGLGKYGKRGYGSLGLGNYGKRGFPIDSLGKYGKRGFAVDSLGKYGKRGFAVDSLGKYGKRGFALGSLGKYGKRSYGLLGLGKYGKRDTNDITDDEESEKRGIPVLGLGKYGKRLDEAQNGHPTDALDDTGEEGDEHVRYLSQDDMYKRAFGNILSHRLDKRSEGDANSPNDETSEEVENDDSARYRNTESDQYDMDVYGRHITNTQAR